jgi:hypothetical protein
MKTKSKIALAASASVVVGALAFSLPSLAHDNGAERGMNSTGPATTSDVERGEGMHGKAGEGTGPKAGRSHGAEEGHGPKDGKGHGPKPGHGPEDHDSEGHGPEGHDSEKEGAENPADQTNG